MEVRIAGWTTDGHAIDIPVAQDQPAVFPVARLIPGLKEAAMVLSPGQRARFWLPKELAYGDGLGGRPGGPLTFDIELIAIQ